jgi:hypothetical protein
VVGVVDCGGGQAVENEHSTKLKLRYRGYYNWLPASL